MAHLSLALLFSRIIGYTLLVGCAVGLLLGFTHGDVLRDNLGDALGNGLGKVQGYSPGEGERNIHGDK